MSFLIKYKMSLVNIIGEGAIIVVGVLFALYIDRQVEEREHNELSFEYAERLRDDIVSDTAHYNLVEGIIDAQIGSQSKIVSMQPISIEEIDHNLIVSAIALNSGTYDVLISQDALKHIDDKDLYFKIAKYYSDQDFYEAFNTQKVRKYNTYIDLLTSYGVFKANEINKVIFDEIFQDKVVRAVCEVRLSYNFFYKDELEKRKSSAVELIEELNNYLTLKD